MGSVTSRGPSHPIRVNSKISRSSTSFGQRVQIRIELLKCSTRKRSPPEPRRNGIEIPSSTSLQDSRTNRSSFLKAENMNLDKLFSWITGVVIACAAVGQLDALQNWVMRSQAKVIYESRTSTWGSPRFFPSPISSSKLRMQKTSNGESK